MANYPVSVAARWRRSYSPSLRIARYSPLSTHLASIRSRLLPEQHRSYENSGKAMPRSGVAVDIREEGRALSHLTCWRQVSPEGAGIACTACGLQRLGDAVLGATTVVARCCGRNPCARRGARFGTQVCAVAFTLVLAGCAVGPDYVPAAAPVRNTFKELQRLEARHAPAITSARRLVGFLPLIPS